MENLQHFPQPGERWKSNVSQLEFVIVKADHINTSVKGVVTPDGTQLYRPCFYSVDTQRLLEGFHPLSDTNATDRETMTHDDYLDSLDYRCSHCQRVFVSSREGDPCPHDTCTGVVYLVNE